MMLKKIKHWMYLHRLGQICSKKNMLDRSSIWLTSSNRSPLFLLNFYYIDIFNQKVVNQHKIIVNQEY